MIPLRAAPPRPGGPPAHLLEAAERELRAIDVYVRLAQDRLVMARRTTGHRPLGGLSADALLRLTTTGAAFLDAADTTLAQIDPQLVQRARVIAEVQREQSPRRPSW